MDKASEAEEGRVRGGRQLNEEARFNALVLFAWSTNRTHLPYSTIANIACKSLCPPGLSAKFECNYLMAKSHWILLNPKRMGMPMLIAMTRMILSKKLFATY